MYLDNCMNPIECQGHRSKVKVKFFVSRPKSIKLFFSDVEKIVVDNVVCRLSIA